MMGGGERDRAGSGILVLGPSAGGPWAACLCAEECGGERVCLRKSILEPKDWLLGVGKEEDKACGGFLPHLRKFTPEAASSVLD